VDDEIFCEIKNITNSTEQPIILTITIIIIITLNCYLKMLSASNLH